MERGLFYALGAASPARFEALLRETRLAESLATAVRARDVSAFQVALGKGAGAHPVYDLWLRLRGKGRSIDTSHRNPAPVDLATADGGVR